jgi:hypothetical protein
MPRANKKRAPNVSSTVATEGSSTAKAPNAVPEPFKQVPSSLQPFVSTLPTSHVYIAHLDKTPVELKRRAFSVPVLLNITIVLGLCIRIYFAIPTYLKQIITIFGYETSYSVNTKAHTTYELIMETGSRFLLLTFDYALFSLLGSWPMEFVFGSKASRWVGLWEWREKVWFKETEVVVRRGRIWDTPMLDDKDGAPRVWIVQDELAIKVKVETAMLPSYTSKTALGLLDKDWDLDYKAMVDAHRMINDGRLKIQDLEGIALVYYQQQWLVWKVREDTEIVPYDPQQEDTLQKFKQKLTELGQEDVFFRWIEVVQYETSQPGGFTQARQRGAIQELKKRLTDRHIDYDAFWKDIGGEAGIPGLGDVRS